MEFWKGFQVAKRVRLVIYGVFVNFSWGRFASQFTVFWASVAFLPAQPANQPAQPSPASLASQTSQSSLFMHKVVLGGQKRTFYARGVEMAIKTGLWWPVFYHTKCFLALRNGPAVREGCK